MDIYILKSGITINGTCDLTVWKQWFQQYIYSVWYINVYICEFEYIEMEMTCFWYTSGNRVCVWVCVFDKMFNAWLFGNFSVPKMTC